MTYHRPYEYDCEQCGGTGTIELGACISCPRYEPCAACEGTGDQRVADERVGQKPSAKEVDHAPRNGVATADVASPGGTGKGGFILDAAHEAVTPSGVRQTPKLQAPGGGDISTRQLSTWTDEPGWVDEVEHDKRDTMPARPRSMGGV